MRRPGARAASSTNIAAKMGMAGLTAAQGQTADKEGDKFGKRRSASSHALAQHQPRPFSRTGSQSKLLHKSNGKQPAQHHDSPVADDEDWVSSSSAVASPAPEPNDEEEDEAIYVNPHLHGRTAHHESPPATPRRSNTRALPQDQRHHPNSDLRNNNNNNPGALHPNPTGAQRHHTTEPNHIRFVGEPGHLHHQHPLDQRIHHNGAAHHVSPPPRMSAVDEAMGQPSSSVVRIAGPSVPEQANKPDAELLLNGDGRRGRGEQASHSRDEQRVHVKQHQDQIIEASPRQIAATSAVRPAVPEDADVGGAHVGQGDSGRMSTQRGFGAALTPLTQVEEGTPSTPLAPSTTNATVSRSASATRPSMLRRDTTPNTVSRSPIVDHPPRSQTPPASMTHDEMVANNNKRHSIHSTGAQRRPMSLFQPSLQGKRHSVASRPLSQHIPGHPAPISLLARLNTLQSGNVTAAPAVSPTYENEDESAYASMSPTRSRAGHTLRRRGSVASINSVATAPVTSTSSATAQGATASPTTQATTSSAILHNLATRPTKHLSMTSRSDVRPDVRRSELRVDDNPLFVSQFCHTRAFNSKGPERCLGEEMAGEEEWESHLSIARYHNLMRDSIGRITAARSLRSK